MKRNLKLLSAILLITLSSCQEENIYEQDQPKKLSVKEVTFSNAKEIKQFDNALTKIFDGIKNHKSTNKNTTLAEDNDFTIDQTTNVKIMSDGNSTTYTMLIKRTIEDPQYFENLVIKIANDSQPKAYIFKYTPSEESHYIYIHNEFSFKGDFEVHEILYNSSVFQPLVNMSGCGNIALCDYGGETHNAGENCTQVYYVAGNCDTTVPDSGGGSIPIYSAPVGSPAGGSAPLQGNVLKMNTFLNSLSFAKKDLFGTFPQGAQDALFNYFVTNNFNNDSKTKVNNFLQSMISNNLAFYFTNDLSAVTINPNLENSTNSIINYLIQNNFSLQSLTFINQMISVSISSGSTFTFDSSLNTTNAISFNNINDIKNYLSNPNASTFTTGTAVLGGERLITTKIGVNSFLFKLSVVIKQNTTSPYKVTNITSSYDGITYGNTWNQTSSAISDSVNNITTIDIAGTQTIAILMGGVGVISTKTRHYRLDMITNTGEVFGTYNLN